MKHKDQHELQESHFANKNVSEVLNLLSPGFKPEIRREQMRIVRPNYYKKIVKITKYNIPKYNWLKNSLFEQPQSKVIAKGAVKQKYSNIIGEIHQSPDLKKGKKGLIVKRPRKVVTARSLVSNSS